MVVVCDRKKNRSMIASARAALFDISEFSQLLGLVERMDAGREFILELFGLTPETLAAPRARVSLEQILFLSNWACATGNNDALLTMARGQRLRGEAGMAVASSVTLFDALGVISCYGPLLNVKFGLIISRPAYDTIHIALDDVYGLPSASKPVLMACELLRLSTMLDGLGFGAETVQYGIAPEDAMVAEALVKMSGLMLAVSAQTGLTISSPNVPLPLPMADKARCARMTRTCEQIMSQNNQLPEIIRCVREEFQSLEYGPPSIGDVAYRLNMSERTLRRRLQALNTSYSKLLADRRFDLAQQHIRRGGSTLDEISEQLGYTETANFRHAFKRWTGQSPRAYRTAQAAA